MTILVQYTTVARPDCKGDERDIALVYEDDLNRKVIIAITDVELISKDDVRPVKEGFRIEPRIGGADLEKKTYESFSPEEALKIAEEMGGDYAVQIDYWMTYFIFRRKSKKA